ncbi:NAD-dependent epimerase [Steroidobacter agaridevorans]|uniref:NAD-dependent epimerase n=1 Tax=Steroidobacter agaridevorans TaxID=2695856 RepID=A0A829YGT8_9GAMM|nr:NAD-dependent epimerase/dehydratase family protein [Steroidobacter agaridevorans]GFE82031.1 NAD-dependent epimerase [Steroidobacter agaridevorans]GFE85580.1 NAD-dependent epimerase [Steroidobacter agaridevorans]
MPIESSPGAVAVTGSTGFIGSVLCPMLSSRGHGLTAIRRELLEASGAVGAARLEQALAGAGAVIHLAARAHVMNEDHADPLAEYRRVNLASTIQIAEAAHRAGVRRFVFVSSIGVLGNNSGDRIFTGSEEPAPIEPYAISKWDAERELRALAQKHAMELVIVRPPLVYGPRVKGNFLRLLRLVHRGVPLPLGSVRNRRSYVGVENLCDFLILCAFHRAAAGRVFVVADGEDVSTPELLRVLARGMNVPSRVFHCPLALLRLAASLGGRRAELHRLTSSLRVDASAARAALGWQPQTGLEAGLIDMARWFAGQVSARGTTT